MILHLIAVPALQRIPIYIWDLGDSSNFYGFPMESEHEDMVKTAFHSTPLQSGSASSSSIAVSGHPADIERLVSDDEVAAIRAVLQQKLPTLNNSLKHTTTCMYTSTPDTHL